MNKINFRCRHTFSSGFRLEVDFCTKEQVIGLFGPSGSGKSSILSMLAGFVTPDEGRIQVGECVLFDHADRINVPCEKRNIGLVSQDHMLFPHMNVEANLKFGMRKTGRQHESESKNFDRICQVLELKPLLQRYPRNLSGGESQRVAIGRALISGPDVLLLDEPLSSLDAELKSKIMLYMQQVIEELKIPVVFVSHRQGHVRRLADWVIVMENGLKITEGVPHEALTHVKPMAWKSSIGPVNLLGLNRVRQLDGEWIGEVGKQLLRLPKAEYDTEKVFLQFAPRDVTLSCSDIEGISSRNHLTGFIRQIVSIERAEFVAVDIGQIIWAEVTARSVQELRLTPGLQVTCLIKAQSLEVVN